MTPTKDQIEEAHRLLRADYYADVRSTAEGIRDELREKIDAMDFGTSESAREWLLDYLHETIDGHGRVIYPAEAQDCLRYSDNDDAYVEDFGTEGIVEDGCIHWSRLALAAFERDVIEQLEAIGVDVNDPLAVPSASV